MQERFIAAEAFLHIQDSMSIKLWWFFGRKDHPKYSMLNGIRYWEPDNLPRFSVACQLVFCTKEIFSRFGLHCDPGDNGCHSMDPEA
jgi:hypothetical protein